MKIYIAGSFSSRERIYDEAEALEELGHHVTGVWFQENDPIEAIWDGNYGGRIAEAMALRDFHALEVADVVIIDTLDPSTSGGRHVELGYVLCYSKFVRPKRVILVGKAEHIFHSLVNENYRSWEELYDESGL
jgi:nucleoside 2-deoxyribosyltransferase